LGHETNDDDDDDDVDDATFSIFRFENDSKKLGHYINYCLKAVKKLYVV